MGSVLGEHHSSSTVLARETLEQGVPPGCAVQWAGEERGHG